MGWNPLEDLEQEVNNLRENPLNTILNWATNYATGGVVGFDGKGFTPGVTTRAVTEGVGEVSGRNDARKANMEAKDALRDEKVARAKMAADELARRQREDLAASSAAGSLRDKAQQQVSKQGFLGNDPSQDFLGL